MKIKICGITNLEDALAAIQCGADLLGFNFYPPSPRSITPEKCAQIQADLKKREKNITTVGVFVNLPIETVSSILEECDLDLAQLSGDEPPEAISALGERAFKGLRPQTLEEAQREANRYARRGPAPTLLVDAYRKGMYGGTGIVGDWSLAKTLAVSRDLLLAGGLTPENVQQALAQVHPWGVDVASGVELTPGKKDAQKMLAFVEAARQFTGRSGPHAVNQTLDGQIEGKEGEEKI
jgi:phosphoribosylanthranilate isomerase